MKIAYFIDRLNGINGGTERQLYLLICGMLKKNHTVVLYVFDHTNYTENVKNFPCVIKALNIQTVMSFLSVSKLINFRRELIRNNIEILHGFFNDTALILPCLTLGMRLNVFSSRRDMGIWYTTFKLYILRVFSFSKVKIICNSNEVANHVIKKENKSGSAIKVIYNGIPKIPRIEPINYKKLLFNYSTNRTNVILVANVRPVKCIEDLIYSGNILKKSGYKINYYIVGKILDVDYQEKLNCLIRQFNLGDTIHMLGQVDEPRYLLQYMDVGVLTSSSEGLSNTILEYLDAGLATIATRVGGNPELITNGKNGFLYQLGNYEELAGLLKRIIDEPSLKTKLSTFAKEKINAFTLENMIDSHESVYMNREKNSFNSFAYTIE